MGGEVLYSFPLSSALFLYRKSLFSIIKNGRGEGELDRFSLLNPPNPKLRSHFSVTEFGKETQKDRTEEAQLGLDSVGSREIYKMLHEENNILWTLRRLISSPLFESNVYTSKITRTQRR